MFGDLEKMCGEIRCQFGVDMFGNLEKTCGEIRWRFGEDVFSDLEKTYSAIFGENMSATRRNRSVILEKTVRR